MRTKRAEETKAALLDVATKLFTTSGWANTGMREVARGAGVAIETLYSYYPSKRTLLEAVVDRSVMGDSESVPVAQRAEFHDTDPPGMAKIPSTLSVTELAQRVAQICLDFKANDVVLLDLKPVSDMADYFIIASGTSDTHVRSMAERVMEEMKKDGSPVNHAEGLTQGRWVLLDFVDFVVHIFHPTLRQFYQLERLWSDAETVALTPGALK